MLLRSGFIPKPNTWLEWALFLVDQRERRVTAFQTAALVAAGLNAQDAASKAHHAFLDESFPEQVAGREKFVRDKNAILEQEIDKVYRIMAVKPAPSGMDILRSHKVGTQIPIQVSRGVKP